MTKTLAIAALALVALSAQARAEDFCASGSYEGMNYLLGDDLQAAGAFSRSLAQMPPEERRRAALDREMVMDNRGKLNKGSVWTSSAARGQYMGCKTGDIIFIPAGSKSVVAVLCDFTKTIATVGPNIMCVKVEERKPY